MVFAVVSPAAFPSGAPAGFAQLLISDATAHRITIWTKTTVQADIDAGVVTLGNTAALHCYLFLYALSTPGAVEYSAFHYNGTNPAVGTVAGFTPAATGDVILCFIEQSANVTPVFATANNNPSWTADAASTIWWNYYSAHATYTTGATGAITATSLNCLKIFGVVAVASPAAPSTFIPQAILL
jgi:hypothetical protein